MVSDVELTLPLSQIPVVSSITCAAPHFTTPRECIIRTVTALPSLPQSSTSTLLLLGTASGSLILASFPSDVDTEAITLARITRYHTDGITDCQMLTNWSSSKDEASLEVETLGRDGVRSVVKVSRRQDEWSMEIVGQQQMTKGLADQVSLSLNTAAATTRLIRRADPAAVSLRSTKRASLRGATRN